MVSRNLSNQVGALFEQGAWSRAREVLQAALRKSPGDHWLLTQLGVTYYEQRRYHAALKLFRESLGIVADCPLTLWNVAGALDAVGRPAEAVPIYTWLLASHYTPDDDSCWESNGWAETLKADCVYRLGVCYRHLDDAAKADHWFRQYINLLMLGARGSYALDDVLQQVRGLYPPAKANGLARDIHSAIEAMLKRSGIRPPRGRRAQPPAVADG